jgi:hypothetical protein
VARLAIDPDLVEIEHMLGAVGGGGRYHGGDVQQLDLAGGQGGGTADAHLENAVSARQALDAGVGRQVGTGRDALDTIECLPGIVVEGELDVGDPCSVGQVERQEAVLRGGSKVY